MNTAAEEIVSAEFLVDVFISRNGRMPNDVDEFEAWIETIDIGVLVEEYYRGWDLAVRAWDIIDRDKAESAKYPGFIISVVAKAS
jgi:hypothetical protein